MTTLLLLTGPAGSGKSTVAATWASRGHAPRAAIDVDALRHMIRAGHARADDAWTAETERQWALAVEMSVVMARVYRTHDVSCVIDIYAPPGPDDMWQPHIDTLGLQRVVLLPSFEVCAARNAARTGHDRLGEEHLRSSYDAFAWCVRHTRPDHVLDNSGLGVEETVDVVEAWIAERA